MQEIDLNRNRQRGRKPYYYEWLKKNTDPSISSGTQDGN